MKKLLPWLLAIAFIVVGVATIGDYGINWDEPLRLLRGQAFLSYFLTGRGVPVKRNVSPVIFSPGTFITRYDISAGEGETIAELPVAPRPQAGQFPGRISFFEDKAWSDYFLRYSQFEAGHLPLPELLGSVSNRIFYQALGIAGDVESYHIPYIIISAFGVLIVSLFTFELTGSAGAALVAGLSFALFPLFWAEAHFNLKDPLVAALFAGAMWSFWHWVKDGSKKIWFILFIALNFMVKWNILFFPVIVAPWLFSKRFPEKKLVPLFVITVVFSIVCMLLIWPVSWAHPLTALTDLVKYYVMIGSGGDTIQPAGFILPLGINAYPLLLFLSQTPEIILLLAVIGIFSMNEISLLLLMWFAVPIIRYSLPFAHAYSGWRQIIEIVPTVAMMSGVGAAFLMKQKIKWARYCTIIVLSIGFLILTGNLISLHPNENAYFNAFAGGLRGASRKNLVDPFITNGNIYKQGALWLNIHAEKNARIAILDGRTFALSPVFLRPDISISPFFFSGFSRNGEYIFVTKANTAAFPANFSYGYVTKFLRPVHEITVSGVPLLTIYKNSSEYLNPGMDREEEIPFTKAHVATQKGNYLELDFPNTVKVTRIVVTNFDHSCAWREPFASFDENVQFEPSNTSYVLTEKTHDAGNTVTYYFPAERARSVKISVISKSSCLATGMVSAVYAQ